MVYCQHVLVAGLGISGYEAAKLALFKNFKVTASSSTTKVEADGGKKVALGRLYGAALREEFNFPTAPPKEEPPRSPSGLNGHE